MNVVIYLLSCEKRDCYATKTADCYLYANAKPIKYHPADVVAAIINGDVVYQDKNIEKIRLGGSWFCADVFLGALLSGISRYDIRQCDPAGLPKRLPKETGSRLRSHFDDLYRYTSSLMEGFGTSGGVSSFDLEFVAESLSAIRGYYDNDSHTSE